MGVPIVNTPFPRLQCNTSPSLLQHVEFCSIPKDGRELPPYPRHYPGPWLGPLSFAARHTPVVPPCIVGAVGASVTADRAERRTACPSSDGATRGQDGPCSKDRRVCCSPWTTQMEGPTTRELAPPRVNSATRSQLTIPRSSLSLIRFAFRRRAPNRCYSAVPVFSGLPTLRQAACRTLW